jgi:hypothetical protein
MTNVFARQQQRHSEDQEVFRSHEVEQEMHAGSLSSESNNMESE